MASTDTALSLSVWCDTTQGRWVIVLNTDLFHPDLLGGKADFTAEELAELYRAGAFFDEGAMIIGELGKWQQIATHLDPEKPRRAEFWIIDDTSPDLVDRIFRDAINTLSVQVAYTTSRSLLVEIAEGLPAD